MVITPEQLQDLRRAIVSLNSGFSVSEMELFFKQKISPLISAGAVDGLKIWLDQLLKYSPELSIINGIMAIFYLELKQWQTAQEYAVLAKKTLAHKEYWQELFDAAALHE